MFLQLINEVLLGYLYRGVSVYHDDILIYNTETKAEHVKLVRVVLKKLRAAEQYAKLPKCEFHQEKVNYFGYWISHGGLEVDPEKVRAILEWAPPHTRKQAQSFLSFANVYRQFIPSLVQIALPITDFLKTKGVDKAKPSQPLEWTKEGQTAFERLQRLFSAKLVLKHPDAEKPFVIQVDASDVALGAALLQKKRPGPTAALCLHVENVDRKPATLGCVGKTCLCAQVGSPHVATLPRRKQYPFPGLDGT